MPAAGAVNPSLFPADVASTRPPPSVTWNSASSEAGSAGVRIMPTCWHLVAANRKASASPVRSSRPTTVAGSVTGWASAAVPSAVTGKWSTHTRKVVSPLGVRRVSVAGPTVAMRPAFSMTDNPLSLGSAVAVSPAGATTAAPAR